MYYYFSDYNYQPQIVLATKSIYICIYICKHFCKYYLHL